MSGGIFSASTVTPASTKMAFNKVILRSPDEIGMTKNLRAVTRSFVLLLKD
jgi:hypothetical protein